MILGAGPAGISAALGLSDAGLRVALIDKASFPRDKVCGDAIPARALRVLKELHPQAAEQLAKHPLKTLSQECLVSSPDGSSFIYKFHTGGYCMRRFDFDGFLMECLQQSGKVDVYLAEDLRAILAEGEGWRIQGASKDWTCTMILGADGANGISAKQLAGFQMDPQHHCAAVRAYFEDVAELKPERMEIHLLKAGLPGYFWIFPVSENSCNVGFGMLSADVARQKVALRSKMLELIASHPDLKRRFEAAKQEGKVQGFGLPLGSRMPKVAGKGFLLLGDAAALIDPATGEGIGNAMWSGQIAARWAMKAFAQQRFDADFLKGYQDELVAKLGKELRRKHQVQRLLGSRPWLINWAIKRAGGNGLVAWLVKKVF